METRGILDKMEEIYLYGAGINCYGVIKFIGKDHIIAIVDNSDSKVGLEMEGIKIISFKEFLKCYHDEPVIISAYHARNEIGKQLNESGVHNCVAAPYMQKGYYESYEEMMFCFEIDKFDNLYIYGENFFSKNFLNVLTLHNKEQIVKGFIRDAKYNLTDYQGMPVLSLKEVPLQANILLMSEVQSEMDREILNKNPLQFHILNMYEAKIRKHQELLKFKNIYKGKRCFIIGNGPSLTVEDLNILKENNEICFGSNWIIKLFQQTKWRPDYYVIVDYNFMRIMPRNMLTSDGYRMITFHADTFQKDIEDDDFTYTYQSIVYEKEKIRFSGDIVSGVYSALTVTYDMLQIAAFMGFSEIYLLGVDCSNGSSHFYQTDTNATKKLEQSTVLDETGWKRQYDAWRTGYGKAEEYSRRHDFRIYNATRGGELEIFERVDFDSLFIK